MKKKVCFSAVYQAILLVLMYMPICVVVAYSFNGSRNSTAWTDGAWTGTGN